MNKLQQIQAKAKELRKDATYNMVYRMLGNGDLHILRAFVAGCALYCPADDFDKAILVELYELIK